MGNFKAQLYGRRLLAGIHFQEGTNQCGSDDIDAVTDFLANVTPTSATALTSFFTMDVTPGCVFYIPMGFITIDVAP